MSTVAGGTRIDPFLDLFGFQADPFELTNSDSEPLLDEYFVPPPFFSAVLGDPQNPRPVAVFAPRGTGKTAQRLSVEARSRTNQDFLCITYDEFGISSRRMLADADLDYHLQQLITRLTLALLAILDETPERVKHITKHERQVLLHCAREMLGSLTQQEYATALGSVKTLKDKGSEFWARYGGVVGNAITVLLKKVKLDDLTIPTEVSASLSRPDSLRYLFEQLLSTVKSVGFSSTYILVDRVDELPQTSQNAQACWQLVRELLINLPFLETPGVGFKFFLWDQIRQSFLDDGGRPDRVLTHELNWKSDDLREMLRRRLSAYSSGRISNIAQLFDPTIGVDVESLIVYLSAESPRDMVRLCKAIVDEATRTGSLPTNGIADRQLFDGIITFSRDYADLVTAGRLPELRKIGSVSFTINRLASDVFNVSENAARSRVQKWMESGLVHKVDERPNRVNRPLHVYAIRDPRVAIACSEGVDLELILDNYLVLCGNCGRLQVVGETSFRCTECDQVQQLSAVTSLWQRVAPDV